MSDDEQGRFRDTAQDRGARLLNRACSFWKLFRSQVAVERQPKHFTSETLAHFLTRLRQHSDLGHAQTFLAIRCEHVACGFQTRAATSCRVPPMFRGYGLEIGAGVEAVTGCSVGAGAGAGVASAGGAGGSSTTNAATLTTLGSSRSLR